MLALGEFFIGTRIERGMVQNTDMYSERYLPVSKIHQSPMFTHHLSNGLLTLFVTEVGSRLDTMNDMTWEFTAKLLTPPPPPPGPKPPPHPV